MQVAAEGMQTLIYLFFFLHCSSNFRCSVHELCKADFTDCCIMKMCHLKFMTQQGNNCLMFSYGLRFDESLPVFPVCSCVLRTQQRLYKHHNFYEVIKLRLIIYTHALACGWGYVNFQNHNDQIGCSHACCQ